MAGGHHLSPAKRAELRRALLAEPNTATYIIALRLGVSETTARTQRRTLKAEGLTDPEQVVVEEGPSIIAGAKEEPTPAEIMDSAFWRRKATAETRRAEQAEHMLREVSGIMQRDLVVPEWTAPVSGSRRRAAGLIHLSDLHTGEVVRREEIGGINEYNPDVFRRRLRRMFAASLEILPRWASDCELEGVVVALNGDLISGDIHDEIRRTNALTSHEQVALAADELAAGISMVADKFGAVLVTVTPGNHGRCYDVETEVLTEDGWKIGATVGPNERIAIYDPQSDEMLFERPASWYVDQYEGDMVRLANKGTDMLVTPSHDLWVKLGWNGQKVGGKLYQYGYSKRKAGERAWGDSWSQQTAPSKWEGTVTPLEVAGTSFRTGFTITPSEEWAALFGWYVSEGNTETDGRITISQSERVNPGKCDEINSLIKRLGFTPYRYLKTIRFSNAPLARFLKEEFGAISGEKKLPKWLRDWPQNLLEAFLDAAFKGDGHWETPTYGKYCTKSDVLIDGMQEVALKLGYFTNSSSPREKTTFGKYSGSARRLGIAKSIHRAMPKAVIAKYSGTIWCPTVSTGLIFVRRNGKVVISGNSTEKTHAKRMAALSYDTMIGSILARQFAGDDRIVINLASGPDILFPLFGWSVLQTHGDSMGTGGGQGFAGPELPIVRGGKKIKLAGFASGERYDIILSAHYHTSSNPGTLLANGSLIGYNEFAQRIRAVPEPPMQWLALVHEKWGLRERVPVVLEDPKRPERPRIKVPAGME